MRVLVACEFSGVVRRAFQARGHEAVSCDLLPAEDLAPWEDGHYQRNVLTILDRKWDLMIAHPPCTHLAVSGARWFADKVVEQLAALEFVQRLLDAPIERIALENPIIQLDQEARPNYPALAVRPWGNQGDLSMAKEPAKAPAHEDR